MKQMKSKCQMPKLDFRIFSFALLLICLGREDIFAQSQFSEKDRLAIVIGAGLYNLAYPCETCLHDADSVSDALGRLGFDILDIRNPRFSDYVRLIDELPARLRAGNYHTVLCYYSGYSYIGEYVHFMPVDGSFQGKISSPSVKVEDFTTGITFHPDIRTSLFGLMQRIAAHSSISMAIVDTDMNSWGESASFPLSIGENQFLAFAAVPGTPAFVDRNGKNSLFTAAWLAHLETPELEMEELYARVLLTLQEKGESMGVRQVPFKVSSLQSRFYFYEK